MEDKQGIKNLDVLEKHSKKKDEANDESSDDKTKDKKSFRKIDMLNPSRWAAPLISTCVIPAKLRNCNVDLRNAIFTDG